MFIFLVLVVLLGLVPCCKFQNVTEISLLNNTNDNDTVGINYTVVKENFRKNWPVKDWEKVGFFTEDYITSINVHWMMFLPPSHGDFYVLGILYIFILIIGIVGNSLVIVLFLRNKSLRTPANTLIFNLSVSDWLMISKTPIFIYNCFNFGPALGDLACRIYGFLGGLTGTVSIVTLAVISFDRYFVIKYPLKMSFSSIRAKICLSVTWTYGFIFAVIPALDVGFGKYTYEGYLTSCSFDYLSNDVKIQNFILIFFVFAWAVPFTLITFSYINIFRVVASRSVAEKKGRESFRHVKEEDSKKQELKLAFIVLSTIILWFLSWTPYAIVALLGISNRRSWIIPSISMIPALFCKTASCINCYVYALSHPKFKAEFHRLFFAADSENKKKNNKVWSTEPSKNQQKPSYKESSDVDQELIDMESGALVEPNRTSFEEGSSLKYPEGDLKRQQSVVEMICLRPSFTNDPSNIRKLARKWSTRETERRKDGDEDDSTQQDD